MRDFDKHVREIQGEQKIFPDQNLEKILILMLLD